MNVNELTLVGRIAKDPRYVDTPNGNVADFKVVVSTNIRRKDGSRIKDTIFMDCEIWGKRSEFIRDNAAKGDTIYVRGRLSKKEYTTTKGEERSKYILKVDKFQLQNLNNYNVAQAEPPVGRDVAASDAKLQDEFDNVPFEEAETQRF